MIRTRFTGFPPGLEPGSYLVDQAVLSVGEDGVPELEFTYAGPAPEKEPKTGKLVKGGGISRYDRAAAAWLREKIPGTRPTLGSVEFDVDNIPGSGVHLHVRWTQTVNQGTELAWEERHAHYFTDGEINELDEIMRELAEWNGGE